jgi:sigma-E factor negative regulatory protein RseB
MISRHLSIPASALFLLISLPAYAANEAYEWLNRIREAARELNYEGVFVYQNGSRLDSMRIYHRAKNGAIEERLISLTGPAREVIRTDREVRCYLPDQNSVYVEHRPLNQQGFPSVIPDQLAGLEQNYKIELGKPGRVSEREAQRVLIRPRDDFRYGYQLWADRETGVLLRAEIMDNKGRVLEQFMFTQIQIGVSIPDSALAAQTSGEGMAWYRDVEVSKPTKQGWRAQRLPKGFQLSSAVMRKLPQRDRPVEQLVYSDGLAAVSVFIEREGDGPITPVRPLPGGGALNAFGRPIDSHNVIAVGEVPAKTLTMITNSLVPASP